MRTIAAEHKPWIGKVLFLKNQKALILSSFHRSIIKAKHSSLAFPQNCGVWEASSTTHVQISAHSLARVFSFSMSYSKVFATYLKPY